MAQQYLWFVIPNIRWHHFFQWFHNCIIRNEGTEHLSTNNELIQNTCEIWCIVYGLYSFGVIFTNQKRDILYLKLMICTFVLLNLFKLCVSCKKKKGFDLFSIYIPSRHTRFIEPDVFIRKPVNKPYSEKY